MSALAEPKSETFAMSDVEITLQYVKNFGVCNLKLPEGKLTFLDVLNVLFLVDMSGSMSDAGANGKTKMEEVKDTLKKTVRCLIVHGDANPHLTQNITIIGFDDKTEIILSKRTLKTIEEGGIKNFEEFIEKKLYPRGTTDIGRALDAATSVAGPISDNPREVTLTLCLTDGDITSGVSEPSLLKTKINGGKNIFIGYGSGHNATLLKDLSETSKENKYKFISGNEKAGMVIGEVLCETLLERLSNCVLESSYGTIYDYKTNTWNDKLELDNLAAGQNSTWYVKKGRGGSGTFILEDASTSVVLTLTCTITGTNEEDEEDELEIRTENFTKDEHVVYKHMFRQKAQELMALVSEHIENKEPTLPYHGGMWNNPPPVDIGNTEMHTMLDMAKQGLWYVVWTMLDKHVDWVNKITGNRRYYLIHHAAYQLNKEAIDELIKRGADLKIKSNGDSTPSRFMLDNRPTSSKTAKEIAESKGTETEIIDLLTYDEEEILLEKDYNKILNDFLAEMKKYMEENDFQEDEMLLQVCDDIYITIRTLTASVNTAKMYLESRRGRNGGNYAWGVSDLTDLEANQTCSYDVDGCNQTPPPPLGLLGRGVSASASQAASDMMRACTD
jgi:hypothetical protein